MFRGRVALTVEAIAVVGCSIVAESFGRERLPLLDLITGCVLGLSGVLACSHTRGRLPGVLLVLAWLTWFAATAGVGSESIRELAIRLGFVHRGLVTHALLATAILRARTGRRIIDRGRARQMRSFVADVIHFQASIP